MEVRGTTHLRNALSRMYNTFTPHTERYKDEFHTHVYGHWLQSIELCGKTIIPIAKDFKKYNGALDANCNTEAKTLVFPLIPKAYPYISKRTADPLVGYLLTERCHPDETMKTVTNSDDEKYYGGSGFILDSDMVPLVIFGIEYDFNAPHKTKSPICIINPVVFQRDDIVSKYIVKKMIPMMSDYRASGYYCNYEDNRIKLLITPMIEEFVLEVAKPNGHIDYALWECATNNLEEILELC